MRSVRPSPCNSRVSSNLGLRRRTSSIFKRSGRSRRTSPPRSSPPRGARPLRDRWPGTPPTVRPRDAYSQSRHIGQQPLDVTASLLATIPRRYLFAPTLPGSIYAATAQFRTVRLTAQAASTVRTIRVPACGRRRWSGITPLASAARSIWNLPPRRDTRRFGQQPLSKI